MQVVLRKAERKMAKLRIGVSAPSGGGKTMASLLIAHGLVGDWKKIVLIDTENGSGELYSHLGEYNVITLEAPFTPEVYIEAIEAAEKAGMEAIIIDSATHEWDGKGGCLEIMESLGGRYQDWSKVTPRHRKFIDAILSSPAHVITTTRRKQDYAMDKEQSGKMTVTKVGMKEVQREGFEYELTIAFDIDIRHNAKASKDRTGLFMDKPEFVITEETGKTLKDWANSGKDEKVEKIEFITDLMTKLGKPVTEKSLAFLQGKTLKDLNNYIGIYTKEYMDLEHKKQTENDPASPEEKTSIQKILFDNGLDEKWLEKEAGKHINGMTKGEVEKWSKFLWDHIENKMNGALEGDTKTEDAKA
jgi:hypothetical protein